MKRNIRPKDPDCTTCSDRFLAPLGEDLVSGVLHPDFEITPCPDCQLHRDDNSDLTEKDKDELSQVLLEAVKEFDKDNAHQDWRPSLDGKRSASENRDIALAQYLAQCVLNSSWRRRYVIGDATMRQVFEPVSLANVSDMQHVFDLVEKVCVKYESEIDRSVGSSYYRGYQKAKSDIRKALGVSK